MGFYHIYPTVYTLHMLNFYFIMLSKRQGVDGDWIVVMTSKTPFSSIQRVYSNKPSWQLFRYGFQDLQSVFLIMGDILNLWYKSF